MRQLAAFPEMVSALSLAVVQTTAVTTVTGSAISVSHRRRELLMSLILPTLLPLKLE